MDGSAGHDPCGTPTPGGACGAANSGSGYRGGGGGTSSNGNPSAAQRFWDWLTKPLRNNKAQKANNPHGSQKPKTQSPLPTPGSKKAPEYRGGTLTEKQFLNQAETYLGPGYREVSPGRYVSADGMRQVRYGAHETRGAHHGHFEAYDRSYYQGGKVVETTTVDIIP